MSTPSQVIIEYLCTVIVPNIFRYPKDYYIALTEKEMWDPLQSKKVIKHFINFWCMSPSCAFQELGNKCRNIILTSGTLAPMDAFESECGVKFDVKLNTPHVIDKGLYIFVSNISKYTVFQTKKCHFT